MNDSTMKNNGPILGLIGVLFISIIGVYAWTYKISSDTTAKLASILETVNNHVQNNSRHVPDSGYISTEVFDITTNSIKENLKEIKADVKMLLLKSNNLAKCNKGETEDL